MKKLYLLIALTTCLFANGQNNLPNFDFAFSMGDEEDDGINDIAIGLDSNIYVTGLFSNDSVDFDPDPNRSVKLGPNIPSSYAASFFFGLYVKYCG